MTDSKFTEKELEIAKFVRDWSIRMRQQTSLPAPSWMQGSEASTPSVDLSAMTVHEVAQFIKSIKDEYGEPGD